MRIKFLAILLLGVTNLFGQRKSTTSTDSQEIETYKTFAYGITTNTNSGLLGGVVLRHSKTISTFKKLPLNRYAAIEIVNIKHPKENSISASTFQNNFSYGKVNYLFSIRPHYGRELIFFKKNNDDGVGISGIIAGGPSIGLQKPYYIRYTSRTNNTIIVQSNPEVQDLRYVQGSAGIWQGFFNNLKVIPGVHAKIAANIDMNTFGNSLTGFEIGATVEYFTKAPEVMSAYLTDNYRFYTAGYLTVYLGNRKQK